MERINYWQELKEEIHKQEEEIKVARVELSERESFLQRLYATVDALQAMGTELKQEDY